MRCNENRKGTFAIDMADIIIADFDRGIYSDTTESNNLWTFLSKDRFYVAAVIV